MQLPFLAKLGSAGTDPIGLNEADKALLQSACSDIRRFPAHRDIVREGDQADHVHLIIEGWACRYKIMPDGSRQITAFMIPGDFCDTHITLFGEMDHSIGAISECQVAVISPEAMGELTARPAVARAFWWASLVDEAVLRSWLCNLGRRDAFDRLGHLFCELHARLQIVDLVEEGRFSLPLTQEDLSDALGLTPVHVNRMLKRLRDQELITLREKTLEILDFKRLKKRVGFDDNYLHLPRRSWTQHSKSIQSGFKADEVKT